MKKKNYIPTVTSGQRVKTVLGWECTCQNEDPELGNLLPSALSQMALISSTLREFHT